MLYIIMLCMEEFGIDQEYATEIVRVQGVYFPPMAGYSNTSREGLVERLRAAKDMFDNRPADIKY